MASIAFLQGRHKVCDGTVDFLADTIKAVLMKSTYSPTIDDDGIATASEISGVAGYTGGFGGAGRKTLASKAVNRDATNDRIEFDCADVAWTSLGAGDTIGGVLVVKEVTNDGASLVLAWDDTNNVATNGGDITYQPNAEGFLQL